MSEQKIIFEVAAHNVSNAEIIKLMDKIPGVIIKPLTDEKGRNFFTACSSEPMDFYKLGMQVFELLNLASVS